MGTLSQTYSKCVCLGRYVQLLSHYCLLLLEFSFKPTTPKSTNYTHTHVFIANYLIIAVLPLPKPRGTHQNVSCYTLSAKKPEVVRGCEA